MSCSGRKVADTLSLMRLSGHIIGLLKEYMQDLVEQARQESQAQQAFGFSAPPQFDWNLLVIFSLRRPNLFQAFRNDFRCSDFQ